jgi:hypothetical protein
LPGAADIRDTSVPATNRLIEYYWNVVLDSTEMQHAQPDRCISNGDFRADDFRGGLAGLGA